MSGITFYVSRFGQRTSVPRIGVALEKDSDVSNRVDECIQALVRIEQQGAARNDEHPFRVPDAAANQARVRRGLAFVELPGVVKGTQAGELPHVSEHAAKRVVNRD